MRHTELLALLREAEGRVPELTCRVTPASFSLNEPDLTAFPRPLDWSWPSCAETLLAWKARGIMMRLPLLWQLESPLRGACDAAGAFVFINDPGNMPLGAAAVRQANIDAVLTDPNDAIMFSQYLSDNNTPLPAFLIVHPLGEPIAAPTPALQRTRVARELHLFPGVPLFVQCVQCSNTKESLFHSVDGYEIESKGAIQTISGKDGEPVALKNYVLPLKLVQEGACSCGKTILRVQ